MPTTTLKDDEISSDGIGIIDLLIKCELVSSRSEGRRLIEQGGVCIGEQKIADISHIVAKNDLKSGVIIKKGKKTFKKAIIG